MTPLSLILIALALGLGACRPGPSEWESLDLLAALPAAESRWERGRIDLGSPASEELLLDGWSWSEQSGDGTSFRWGTDQRSRLALFVAEPRAVTLRARGLPFSWQGEPQDVSVRVNGVAVARTRLRDGWQDVEVAVPARVLQAGVNTLEFEYHRAPVEDPGGSRRLLSVAWDRIEWQAWGEGEPPRAEEGNLILPFGSQVDYFLDLPRGGRLALASVALGGGSRGNLVVGLEADQGGWTETTSIPAQPGERSLEIAPGLVRLRLRSVAAAGSGSGHVRIEAPRLAMPRSPGGSPASPGPGKASVPLGPPPNLIVYLVDTLRADRLGSYGSSSGLTPRLDAFAADSVVFEHAVAQSSWTVPSVASLFTGQLPWVHGMNDKQTSLPEGLLTLAEYLRRAGFRTLGIAANGYLGQAFGFQRGFDRFELLRGDAGLLHSRLFEWLDAESSSAPLFVYVHTVDPHHPYEPPVEERRRFASGVRDPASGSLETVMALMEDRLEATPERIADHLALYDAEVAAADRLFGEFVDELERRGLYDSALVLFLSDHGEEFYEHGDWIHGRSLYSEVLRVPLILKLPGSRLAGTRVAEPVQHLDLFPTFASLLDREVELPLPGRDLAALLERPAANPAPCRGGGERLFSYLDIDRYSAAGVVCGRWQLIVPRSRAVGFEPELYDWATDPEDRDDLAARRPVLAGYLASLVRARLAAAEEVQPAPTVELDDETRQMLRALGYLD